MITDQRLAQLRAERDAEALAKLHAQMRVQQGLQRAYEAGKRLAAEAMSWQQLARLTEFQGLLCGPFWHVHRVLPSSARLEAILGRDFVASLALGDDEEVRAFLAGVADVRAAVK